MIVNGSLNLNTNAAKSAIRHANPCRQSQSGQTVRKLPSHAQILKSAPRLHQPVPKEDKTRAIDQGLVFRSLRWQFDHQAKAYLCKGNTASFSQTYCRSHDDKVDPSKTLIKAIIQRKEATSWDFKALTDWLTETAQTLKIKLAVSKVD